MLPETEKSGCYARYLRGEQDSGLSLAEIDALQTWLIEAGYDEDEGNWEEKLCYYCRHMHDEWGAEWTNDYFSGKDELYNGWVEDIKKRCKSHHWGYAELAERSFDPIRSDGNIIHGRGAAGCGCAGVRPGTHAARPVWPSPD
jgi:hypothetical protein